MAKARSKRGAAMVMVIITTVLFTMMSFSLISASSTLSSSARRKWTQLRMEQQALGVGRAFSEYLTYIEDPDDPEIKNDLQIKMDSFLDSPSYSSYNLNSSEGVKQAAIHSFAQPSTEINPDGYGQVIIRLKKIEQYSDLQLDTGKEIEAGDRLSRKDFLDDFLDSVTYADYQLTAFITVVSPEDAQALGTAEVTFFRILRYEAQYYKNSLTSERIYPDSNGYFFTTPDKESMNSGTLVDITATDIIITYAPSSPKTTFYVIAEVR